MKMSDAARLQWAQAMVVTGIVLYVPANVLPVMTMSIVGTVEPLTVLGGVEELYDSGLWPMAAVVFLASIVVPFLKLVSLSWILLMHGKPVLQRQRGNLRRIVHSIGSWSMVDVFLLAILAGGVLGLKRLEEGSLPAALKALVQSRGRLAAPADGNPRPNQGNGCTG